MKKTTLLIIILATAFSGCKSLNDAAMKGDASRVRQLITGGADINAKDKSGKTALMYAADKGQGEIVKMLVDAGADVNAKDKEGRTALMYAASADSAEVIVSLVQGGADAEAEDNSGEIALFMTRKKSKAREELLKHSTQYRSQFLCKINTLFRYLKSYPEITVSYIGREDSGIGKVYYGDGVRLEQHDGLFPEMISVLKTYNVVFTDDFFKSLDKCKK